ncbi:MAG: M48 family metalloprotease [Phycisphaerales bacterium]|nr:M48 family metalloprotease [Phycisphaerales bacterium]
MTQAPAGNNQGTAPAAPNSGGSPALTVLMLAVVGVGGYIAYQKFFATPAQQVNNAVNAVQQTIQGITGGSKTGTPGGQPTPPASGGSGNPLTDLLNNVDPNAAISKGTELIQGASKVGVDVAHEFIGLSADEEWAIGEQYYGQMRPQLKVLNDPTLHTRLWTLAKPMLAATQRSANRPWTIDIIDEPIVNAMTMPGGHILIYKGLIDELKTDAAIQGVIGHEIAHVELEQLAKRMMPAVRAAEQAGDLAGALSSQLFGLLAVGYGEDEEFDCDEWAYRSMAAIGRTKPERLAFVIGLKNYSDRSGHNDTLDQRQGQVSKTIANEVRKHFRTHPSAATRVDRLQALP